MRARRHSLLFSLADLDAACLISRLRPDLSVMTALALARWARLVEERSWS